MQRLLGLQGLLVLCKSPCTALGSASHRPCPLVQAAAAAPASQTASRQSHSRPVTLAPVAASQQHCLPTGTPSSHRRCTGWASGTCMAWWAYPLQSWPLPRRWADLLTAELHRWGAAVGVTSKAMTRLGALLEALLLSEGSSPASWSHTESCLQKGHSSLLTAARECVPATFSSTPLPVL